MIWIELKWPYSRINMGIHMNESIIDRQCSQLHPSSRHIFNSFSLPIDIDIDVGGAIATVIVDVFILIWCVVDLEQGTICVLCCCCTICSLFPVPWSIIAVQHEMQHTHTHTYAHASRGRLITRLECLLEPKDRLHSIDLPFLSIHELNAHTFFIQ